MSQSFSDLLATDALLDRIALREFGGADDLVLMSLALLATAIDAEPLPPLTEAGRVQSPMDRPSAPMPFVAPTPMTRTRKGGLALSAAVALMLSTTGMAAAVAGDPLAPLHYVANHVWNRGPDTDAPIPGWSLDGSMRISKAVGKAPTEAMAQMPASTQSGLTDSGQGSAHAPGRPSGGGHHSKGSPQPPSSGQGPGKGGHPRPPRNPVRIGKVPGKTDPGGSNPGSPREPGQPTRHHKASPRDGHLTSMGRSAPPDGTSAAPAHASRTPRSDAQAKAPRVD